MKCEFYVFIIISCGLTGCSNTPVVGEKEPQEAAEYCAAQVASYVPDGHIYTTLAIANIGGYDDTRQMTLSYYSQYPDIDTDYEAVPVSFKYLLLPWKWKWRNDITGDLHSLHGGDRLAIDARREHIHAALLGSLEDPALDWQSGLIIHAYGDSFAHTKNLYGSEEERAYNVWIGHAIPSLLGNSPDKIKNAVNEPKYLGYITDLYSTSKRENGNDEEFIEFKKFVDNLECKGDRCPNFHALFNEQSPEESSRIDAFTKCMNETSRQLSTAEVQQTMDLIDGTKAK